MCALQIIEIQRAAVQRTSPHYSSIFRGGEVQTYQMALLLNGLPAALVDVQRDVSGCSRKVQLSRRVITSPDISK